MKKSFTKILGLATLAMAAIFMTGCPTDPNQGGCKEPEPDTPETTIDTRIAIDTSEAFAGFVNEVENDSVDLSTWEDIYFYAYNDEGGSENVIKPFGEWPGIKASQIGDSAVYYANFPSTLDADKGFAIIVNNYGDSKVNVNGSINKGDVKIYKIVDEAATLVDWDAAGANDDDPAAGNGDNEGGETPAPSTSWTFAEEGTVTRVAIDVSEAFGEINAASWTDKYIYIYIEDDTKEPKKIEPLGGWTNTKLTQIDDSNIYYANLPPSNTPVGVNLNVMFHGADGETQFDAGAIKAGESKIYKLVDGTASFVDWDGNGAAEYTKPTGKLIIAVSAENAGVAGAASVYAYAYNESYTGDAKEPLGGWPGKELTLNSELGIYVLEADVADATAGSYTVIINAKNEEGTESFNKGVGGININETKIYNRINDWVTWDGTSKDTSEVATLDENSTIIAVDLTKVTFGESSTSATGWTGVGVYTYNNEIFGGWGSLILEKSEVTDTLFYANVTGKTGSGTSIVYNTAVESERVEGPSLTVEAGKKYIFQDNQWKEWTDFDLSKIVAE